MPNNNEPVVPNPTLDFISHSTTQTQRVGSRLGEMLQAGDVVLLEGPLGSGKTLMAQGIAQGIGISDYVTSPSFTLVNEYRPRDCGGRLPLYHVDLYRLGDASKEASAMGMEEYLYGDGVSVIEWAERAVDILPPEHLLIRLSIVSDSKRGVLMIPHGARYLELLREFKRRAFGV
jgi:tRNA threonylcarbamoyladenosine biosynthesis protein TsaE